MSVSAHVLAGTPTLQGWEETHVLAGLVLRLLLTNSWTSSSGLPFTISFRQATPINSAIFYGEPNCSARRIPQVRLERLSANSSIGRDRNADPWKMAGWSNISVMKASGFL